MPVRISSSTLAARSRASASESSCTDAIEIRRVCFFFPNRKSR
jgi:hypothetical protein